MEFSLHGKVSEQQAIKEREKAVKSAKYPAFSKYGNVLMAMSLRKNQAQTKKLAYLDLQMKRTEIETNHKKRFFLKRCQVLNHDPIIVVERPPSYTVLSKTSNNGDFFGKSSLPHYMTQLNCKMKIPSTLTTTEVFIVKSKIKRNIWDETKEGVINDSKTFQSTVLPTDRLSHREQSSLQMAFSFHKPRVTPEEKVYSAQSHRKSASSRTSAVQTLKPIEYYVTGQEHFSNAEKMKNIGGEYKVATFITQLSDRSKNESERMNKFNEHKNVRLTKQDWKK